MRNGMTRRQVIEWEIEHEGYNMGMEARDDYYYQWARLYYDREKTDLEFDAWLDLPDHV